MQESQQIDENVFKATETLKFVYCRRFQKIISNAKSEMVLNTFRIFMKSTYLVNMKTTLPSLS